MEIGCFPRRRKVEAGDQSGGPRALRPGHARPRPRGAATCGTQDRPL